MARSIWMSAKGQQHHAIGEQNYVSLGFVKKHMLVIAAMLPCDNACSFCEDLHNPRQPVDMHPQLGIPIVEVMMARS